MVKIFTIILISVNSKRNTSITSLNTQFSIYPIVYLKC